MIDYRMWPRGLRFVGWLFLIEQYYRLAELSGAAVWSGVGLQTWMKKEETEG